MFWWWRSIYVSTGIGYFSAVLLDSDAIVLSINFIDPAFLFLVTIGVSLFTTFILMGTVGRIWMLARRAQRVLGAELTGTSHSLRHDVRRALESGALYLWWDVYIVVAGLERINVTSGIAPTIIAARVALGQSVENVNSFIVPRPRVGSPFHPVARAPALDQRDDDSEVLYIGQESVKVEAV
ncbi:hypothetical protein GGX14DRAFT_409340 [Mycena pura]|uniref:Uncharacterized protein n=1 Tax=Mycena pura TaxID=153505 RepID=A0AAD6UNU2_9AGAR|nr:hypothetical protein GGX14DRAFT_409340 [Mycena pura]